MSPQPDPNEDHRLRDMPPAEQKHVWLDPSKWERTQRFTAISAARPDQQLRVEVWDSRTILPRSRVWAEVYQRATTEAGGQDFVPTGAMLAFEVDLTSRLETLIAHREKDAAERRQRGG